MDLPIARAHGACAQDVLLALAIRDPAARLPDQQCTSCAVPWAEIWLEPGVQSAAGDPSEADRRSTEDAYRAAARRRQQAHRPEAGGRGAWVRWRPRRHHGVGQRRHPGRGDRDRGAVERGSGTQRRREEFVSERVVDHPGVQGTVECHPDGDSRHRLATDEVGCAIDGVNDPEPAGAGNERVHGLPRADGLLPEKGVVSEGLEYGLAYDLLALGVDRGQQVSGVVLDLHHLCPDLGGHQAACRPGGSLGHPQHGRGLGRRLC
mmetsp:Transcript_25556/g.85462  ORF Transcript_25556/g.85462 Transcript_25556/m.85462 type:complete len:263 (+) Transcript_25556:254-1042(+)